eukprot:10151689-Alexandrium_andersonii.AAC.1
MSQLDFLGSICRALLFSPLLGAHALAVKPKQHLNLVHAVLDTARCALSGYARKRPQQPKQHPQLPKRA